MTGNKKAAVLPLPVWLETSKSLAGLSALSCRAKGMARICTGVGWVNDKSRNAASNSGASPISTKPEPSTEAMALGGETVIAAEFSSVVSTTTSAKA